MNDLQMDSEVSVTQLVSGIIHDVQKLIQQQLALLRYELQDELAKTKRASVALLAGSVVALVGGILLCLMLIHLLAWAAPELPLWVCYGIVGVPIAALGGALLFVGIRQFQSWHLLPEQSLQALKENMQWLKNPK